MAENMLAGAAGEAMVTETIHVAETRIACDGGGGPLGGRSPAHAVQQSAMDE